MTMVRRTVLVDDEDIPDPREITLAEITRQGLKAWLQPENEDLRHSMRLSTMESKIKLLEEELKFLEQRKPQIETAISRYKAMIKDETEYYEAARKTTILNKYMAKISELIIMFQFDHERIKKECRENIMHIKEINPYFNIDAWIETLRDDML